MERRDTKMEANINIRFQYAVVEFLQLPHSYIDDYVCVPHSWIQTRRAKDRKTSVAFPDEARMLTEMRIKNCEKPLKTWNVYMAIIKYETTTYNDANLFILRKKKASSTQKKHSALKSDHTSLPNTATNIRFSFEEINESKPHSKTNEEITKVLTKSKIPKPSQSAGYANLESEKPPSHILKNMNEPLVSTFRSDTQGLKGNIFHAPQNLVLKNGYLHDCTESDEKVCSQNEGPVVKRPRKYFLNQEARVQDIAANTSFDIQSPIYKNQPRVLLTRMTLGQTSEIELTSQIPTNSNSAEHRDSNTQSMFVDELTEESCNEQAVQSERSTEFESLSSINSRENLGQSCQSVVIDKEETTTDEASSTEETDTEDLLTDGKFVDELHQSADSKSNNRDRWRCKLVEIVDELDCDFSRACEVTSEVHKTFVETITLINDMRSIDLSIESFLNEIVKQVSVVKPKDVTVIDNKTIVKDKNEDNEAEKKKEELPDDDMNKDDEKSGDKKIKTTKDNKRKDREIKNSEDDNDDDGDDGYDNNDGDDEGSKNIEDDEENRAPKKTRGHIRTFVLPEEYDSNDSRWTLKYPKYKSKLNLVELFPRTKVYINSIRLSNCLRVAKDSKTLARMLLVEIFSKTALSVCSLTGARANAFEIGRIKVRPGLDEHARMVMLNFVEEHARKKKWGVFDSQSVINSIRSKIQEMRAKYGQTE